MTTAAPPDRFASPPFGSARAELKPFMYAKNMNDENYMQLMPDPKPLSDEDLLRCLRAGLRFTVTAPGDWEFVVGKDNRFVLRRTK